MDPSRSAGTGRVLRYVEFFGSSRYETSFDRALVRRSGCHGDIPLTDRRPAAGDIVSRETGKPLRAGVMLGVLLCLSRTPSHTAVGQFLMHQEWPQLNASSNPPYRARQRPLGLTAHFSNFVPTICARASSTHLVSALAGSSGGTGSGSSWDYASFRQRRGQARSKRAHTRWCLRWKG